MTSNFFSLVTTNDFSIKDNSSFWFEIMQTEKKIARICTFDALFHVILRSEHLK